MAKRKRRSDYFLDMKPQDMSERQLPTYKDVLQFIFYEQDRVREQLAINSKDGKHPEPHIKPIIDAAAKRVELIWQKASLPTISMQRILHLIMKYYQEFRVLKKKNPATKQETHDKKLADFKENAEQLFNVCTCKCKVNILSECECPVSRAVPAREWDFYQDQVKSRRMAIGSVDFKTTKILSQRMNRKVRAEKFLQSSKARLAPKTSNTFPTDEEKDDTDDDPFREEDEFVPRTGRLRAAKGLRKRQDKSEDTTSQMPVKLPKTALTCERIGIEPGKAALLASSILEDFKIVKPECTAMVVDRYKLRREMDSMRKEITKEELSNLGPIRALCFDGKKDVSLTQDEGAGRMHLMLKPNEEHIVMIAEPGSK